MYALHMQVLFIAETFGFCCVFLIIEGENLAHQVYLPYMPMPYMYALYETYALYVYPVLSALFSRAKTSRTRFICMPYIHMPYMYAL